MAFFFVVALLTVVSFISAAFVAVVLGAGIAGWFDRKESEPNEGGVNPL